MNILDPKFRYVDSHSTDLRKTFARIRREARANAQPAESRDKPAVAAVVKLAIARKSTG